MNTTPEPIVTIEGGPLDGTSIPIAGERLTLGRDDENDVVIRGSGVSRTHAEIVEGEQIYLVRDLGSTNGTFVNGDPVSERPLSHGDVIRLGPSMVSLVFRTEGSRTVQVATVQPLQEPPQPSARPSDRILRYLQSHPDGAGWDELEAKTGLSGPDLTNAMARLVKRGEAHQRKQTFFAGKGQEAAEAAVADTPEHYCEEHGMPFERYTGTDVVVYGHVVGGTWCAEETELRSRFG
ncbi:MAG: FHA domain-containing protein [Chloroflexi bacterium]|nr:FHA domain-containing protein [Chloroflexota bacterium]